MKSLPTLCCFATLAVLLTQVSQATAQDTAAATRQYAAAAALQNRELYDLAADEWKKFLEKFSKDMRLDAASHNLGVCQSLSKKYPDAIKTLSSIPTKFPKFKNLDETYLQLGLAQYNQARSANDPKSYAAAAATFGTLIEKFPESKQLPTARFYQGESHYAQNKREDAIKSYALFVANHEKDALLPDALYALGVTQQELDQKEPAGKTFDDFLKQFEKHRLVPEVQMRRAELFYAAEQADKAAPLFAAAAGAEAFQMADYCFYRVGGCLQRQKKYEEASKQYDQLATKFEKSEYIPRSQLASGQCLYLANKFPEARSVLAKPLAAKTPEAPECAHWIARSWLKQAEPNAAEALKASEAGLKLAEVEKSSYFVQLKLDRADALYEDEGTRVQAPAAYLEIAEKHGDNSAAAEALYMAALSSLQNKKYEDGVKHATLFREKFKDNEFTPDVIYVAAEAQLQLKKLPESEALYKELRSKYPDHPMAQQGGVREGLSLYLQKKYPQAIESLNKFLTQAKQPEQVAEAHHVIGRCQVELKKFPEAAAAFAAALKAKADWQRSDESTLLWGHALVQAGKADEAKAKFLELIEKYKESPHLPETHYRLAEVLYGASDYKGAGGHYAITAEKYPESQFAPHALHGLGWAQYSDGQTAEAVKTLTTQLEKFPNHELAPKALYVRALAEHQLKQFDKGIADLEKFLKTSPDTRAASDARYVLGLCYVGQEKWAEAEKTFTELIAADAEYPSGDKVFYELGWARRSIDGKLTAAIDAFSNLAEKYPDSGYAAEANYHVAEFHYDQGTAKNKQAAELTEKAEIDKVTGEAKQEFTAAVKAYLQAQEKAGKTDLGEKAAHKTGWAYFRLDQYDEGAKQFAKQVAEFPTGGLTADGIFMQAESLFKQKKYPEAAPIYEKAIGGLIKAGETGNATFLQLSLLHGAQSMAKLKPANWSKSLELLASLIKQFPESAYLAEARYEQGWAQQNTEKFAEAIKSYESAADLAKTNEVAGRAWFMQGEVHFAQKKHDEAIRCFIQASVFPYPDIASDALYEAGRCFELRKQPDKAKGMYNDLIKKYPQSAHVEAAKKRLMDLGG